jgi:hypothetical protein
MAQGLTNMQHTILHPNWPHLKAPGLSAVEVVALLPGSRPRSFAQARKPL